MKVTSRKDSPKAILQGRQNRGPLEPMIDALILDDDPDDALLLVHTLERAFPTCCCRTASTVEHFWALFEQRTPTFVFCDLIIGADDGLDVLAQLRRTDARVPFVLITGLDERSLVNRAVTAGADDYISKDEISPRFLERTVKHSMIRRSQQEQLMVERAWFKAVFFQSGRRLAMVDEKGHVVRCNPLFEAYVPRRLLLRENNLSELGLWRSEYVEDDLAALKTKGAEPLVFRISHAESDLTVRVCPIELFHEIALFLYDAEDVTALKEAKALAEHRSLLLARLSHELKTPLNAVLGYAQLLENEDLPPEQSGQVGTIATAGRSMVSLIDRMMDLARLEAGSFTLYEEPFLLSHALREVVDLHAVDLADAPVSLTLRIDPSVDHWFVGDEGRLRQILSNLVGNAKKFTKRGKITVEAGSVESGTVVISVTDTGCGIREDDVAGLFVNFYQGGGAQDRRDGLGLGLPLCKELCERMGGTIKLSSERGVGTQVRICLPLRAASASENAPRHDDTEEKDGRILPGIDPPLPEEVMNRIAELAESADHSGLTEALEGVRDSAPHFYARAHRLLGSFDYAGLTVLLRWDPRRSPDSRNI